MNQNGTRRHSDEAGAVDVAICARFSLTERELLAVKSNRVEEIR